MKRSATLLVAAALLPLMCAELSAQPTSPPPYIPTPDALVEAMLGMAALQPGDLLVDLGSGDGRIVITAAERGARGVGIEYDLALVEWSRILAREAGVEDRVAFRRADLFATDLTGADVVTLYLSHEFNQRLRPRLLEQLEPGSRVVSHGFHMGPWQPDSTVVIGTGAERATLYGWIVPARVDGFWYLDIEGSRGVTLEFVQEYQQLSGALSRGSGSLALEGEMRGREVRFETTERIDGREERLVFLGRLDEGRLTGIVNGPADWGPRRWTAYRFEDLDDPR